MTQEEVLVETQTQPGVLPVAETPVPPAAATPGEATANAPAPAPSGASSSLDGIMLLAIYHFVLAGLFLLGTVGVSLPAAITAIVGIVDDPGALIATAILGVIAVVLMFFTAFFLALGYGLLKRRQWARIASMVVAVLSLFFIPIGTIIGGFTIWYLIQPEVVSQFEG
jgi:hypothetical protein